MDGNKVNSVLDTIEKRLQEMGIEPLDADPNLVFDSRHDQTEREAITLGHCLGMIPKMRAFIAESRMDKTFRWLGFIQGALWASGAYSINEMKNHNRPDADA